MGPRFALGFADGGGPRDARPRRLGAVELDPDEGRWGWTPRRSRQRSSCDLLAGSSAPLKARLMDQSRIAGIGNLLVDETLWRAGLDPARPASSLDPSELRCPHRHLRVTLDELGSRAVATGDLTTPAGGAGPAPRRRPLLRRTVGGRTTHLSRAPALSPRPGAGCLEVGVSAR